MFINLFLNLKSNIVNHFMSLRILYIIPSLEKGGAERLVIDICNELNKRKEIEVKLIILHDKNSYPFLTENINLKICPVRVIPSLTGKSIIEIENLKELINNYKPDIIHSHLYEAEVVSREYIYDSAAYFSHVHDNIVQFMNFSINTILNKRKITNYFEKIRITLRYKKCRNNFIAISNDTFNYTLKTLPKKIKNVTLLPNAVDFKRFNNVININKRQEVNKTIKKIVTIGSLVNKKNQIFLIDVVKFLKQTGINVTLNILGNGPNYNLINNKIIEEGLENQIFLRGSVDNVEEYLQESYIYVHSATYEPFGLVLLEAMASGLPCVTLDGKGNRDIIKENINGFIIQKPDYKIFADKIILLINDEFKYKVMSENAIKTAIMYDITSYANKLLELYYEKLNAKK
jgi:glycosyltransferase involved in cell wall biosynthesis